jgi:hypothetical protein
MSISNNFVTFPAKHLLRTLVLRGLNPQVGVDDFGNLILSWDSPHKGKDPVGVAGPEAFPETRFSVGLSEVTVARTEQGCTPYFNGQDLVKEIEEENLTYSD